MKNYLSKSGLVLGLFAAAALAGCADEGASPSTEETQSAITSQGFLVNGCAGTGIFNITSNNLIDFVALDQSSFSNVNARVYALNQNGEQRLISNTQNASSLSSAFTSMLDQVSNYTSALQQATMLAQQNRAQHANQYATNLNAANSISTSANTAAHQATGQRTAWSGNQANGYANDWTTNRANTWQNQAERASGYGAQNAASLNAITSNEQQFANAGQWANANQGATNGRSAYGNQGALNSARNATSSSAMNGAVNSGIMNNGSVGITGGMAAAPVGYGWGGFGYAPVISNTSAFNNNAVFGNQFANASNRNLAAQNGSRYANLIDNTFSNVRSAANQASYNNAGSNAITAQRSNAVNSHNSANQASAQSNLVNNAANRNAYNKADYQRTTSGFNENNIVADRATQVSSMLGQNNVLSAQGSQAGSLDRANTLSQQTTGSNSVNRANSQQMNQQYQAMTNLAQYASNNMVLVLDVTAKSDQAVLNVFTGNSANKVAANNSFVQPFAGCGLTGAAVPVAAAAAPAILPAAHDAVVADQVVEALGDHVAKPE